MKGTVKKLFIIYVILVLLCAVVGCDFELSDKLTDYNYREPRPTPIEITDYREAENSSIKKKFSGELKERKSNNDFKYSVYTNGVQIDGVNKNNLSSVVIPSEIDGVAVIGISEDAFCDNNDITEIVIPETVKYIGYSAFRRCKNLESVTLCDGLEYVASYAFDSCKSIKTITFPNTIKYIGIYACALSGVENISIPSPMNYVPDGMYYGSCIKDFDLPEQVVYICSLAFSKCEGLEEITIPGSVMIIWNTAFANNVNLKRVVIEEGCEEISAGVFEGCIAIEEAHLPQSVEHYSTTIFSDANKDVMLYVKKGSKMEEFAINAKLNYVEE